MVRYRYTPAATAAAAAVAAARKAQEDLHTAAAAEFFKVPTTQVTPEQRQLTKLGAFSDVYGTRGVTQCQN